MRGAASPNRCASGRGYVPTKDGTTVRVRIVGDEAFLTLKDRAVGLVRHEFEYPIPVGDAETILDTMCGDLVEKNRYRIPAKEPGLVWEVDEFFGDNAPLVTAEIEAADLRFVEGGRRCDTMIMFEYLGDKKHLAKLRPEILDVLQKTPDKLPPKEQELLKEAPRGTAL